jgi:glucan phosphoethanolaminetransferase (alkaline phosphatase superfamily)
MKSKTILLSISLMMFVVLICFVQAINSPISFLIETDYLSQPHDKKGFIKGSLFFISYFISVCAIVSVVFIANKWIALTLITTFSFIFGIDIYAQLLGSSPNGITLAGLSTALTEKGRLTDLLVYRQPLIYFITATLVFFLAALLIRRLISRRNRISAAWSLLFLGLVIVSIGLLSYKIPSITIQSYPAPIKLPLLLNQYLLEKSANKIRVLDEQVKPTQPASYKTIVWIIDESILGNYLSLNGYEKKTTPFLDSLSTSSQMQNYGVVNSISNCSNTSNLLLRIGLTTSVQQDFKTAKNTLPTIFQYAKRAGFETYLIDGQIAPGEMQNHLSNADLKFIDQSIAYPHSIYPKDRDSAILKTLQPLLADTQQARFIVVVKWGAHWPYPLDYPPEQAPFQPAATESLTDMSLKNKEIIINAYLNAVNYGVDTFLQRLLAKPVSKEQVIFYTSDHGQSFFSVDDGALTHCHYNTNTAALPLDEFRVPLMVFAENAKQQFPKLENRLYAQEQLFPTTLELFGFDSKLVAKYGPTLLQGSKNSSAESFVLDSGLKVKVTNN